MEAEQSEDYKQILTHVMVTRESRILAFRRGTFNRVEDYLRGSTCIGFWGTRFRAGPYSLQLRRGPGRNRQRKEGALRGIRPSAKG